MLTREKVDRTKYTRTKCDDSVSQAIDMVLSKLIRRLKLPLS